jgi:hypothetical protein
LDAVIPPGTGQTWWANVTLDWYTQGQIGKNISRYTKNDGLFNYFHSNKNQFFLGSHTTTHENLDLCSYTDAYNELTVNKNFAAAAGWSKLKTYSETAIVTPGISGLFSADALKALKTAGYVSVVGDTSRPKTINLDNPYWALASTAEKNGLDGMLFIPRDPTNIYFNTSTPNEVSALYNEIYPNLQKDWNGILKYEIGRVMYKMFMLKWNGYVCYY